MPIYGKIDLNTNNHLLFVSCFCIGNDTTSEMVDFCLFTGKINKYNSS